MRAVRSSWSPNRGQERLNPCANFKSTWPQRRAAGEREGPGGVIGLSSHHVASYKIARTAQVALFVLAQPVNQTDLMHCMKRMNIAASKDENGAILPPRRRLGSMEEAASNDLTRQLLSAL